MSKENLYDIEDYCAEERLVIRAFKSACALKNEIRKRIRERAEDHWDFCGLSSKGAFIFLCFQKHPESEALPSQTRHCLQC